MTITGNGRERAIDPGATVTDLLAELGLGPTGSAVAVNGEVLPRGAWPRRALADGDDVDVLTAVQGG